MGARHHLGQACDVGQRRVQNVLASSHRRDLNGQWAVGEVLGLRGS